MIKRSLYSKHSNWSKFLEPKWYRLVRGYERSRALKMRDRFDPFYIGVTGSCGKSTTVRLISEILRTGYRKDVFERIADNTERAVFASLRKLSRKNQTLVQEISGGGGDGYLDYILEDVPIDIAVITAIGADHYRAFSSKAAIPLEKIKLVQGLAPNGVACLNIDDKEIKNLVGHVPEGRRIVTYGCSEDADVRAEVTTSDWKSRLAFRLFVGAKSYNVQTQFVGTLMLSNVLASLAVVHGKGLALEEAIDAISKVQPVENHLSFETSNSGHSFLMDAFKAPLWSTKLLMDDLPNIKNGPLVLVLGQLSETGSGGSIRYRQTITQAVPHCDLIIGTGAAYNSARKRQQREPDGNVLACETIGDILDAIRRFDNALVVVKSAKLAKLWRVYEACNEAITCTVMPCKLALGCKYCPLLRD